MANIKEKVKNFWEEHKTDICVIGGIAIVSIGVGVWTYKSYMDGFRYGTANGFHLALDWFDGTFPEESRLNELWNAWVKEHPEETLWVKPSGKVIKG